MAIVARNPRSVIADLFRSNELVARTLEEQARANILLDCQSERWGRLLQPFEARIHALGLEDFRREATRGALVEHTETDGIVLLRAALPLIVDSPSETDMEVLKSDPGESLAVILSAVHAYTPDALPITVDFWLGVADAKLAEARDEQRASEARLISNVEMTRNIETAMTALENENARLKSHWNSLFKALSTEGREAVEALQQAVVLANSSVEKSTEHHLQEIERLANAQGQLITIRPTVELWTEKATAHRSAFYGGCLVFGVFLLCSAILFGLLASSYAHNIAQAVAGHDILGVALVAAPLLAAAWVLRLISRFALTNLTLWEDANQRRATAQTYLGLLSDTSRPISSEERALALAALFRPAAGSGGDDVTPPNLLDLLKARES